MSGARHSGTLTWRRRVPGQSANGCVRHKALYHNHVWSYDFLVDRTEDGRQLKLLVVIDEFTRECLAAEVGRTFTARDVMLTLQYLFAVRGAPERQRSGVHRERVAALVGACGSEHALHPESESLGKWLRGEF
jgi:putative transposase